MRRLLLLLAAVVLLAAPTCASGAPMPLSAIDAMSQVLRCRALCYAPVGREACLAGCPAIDPAWERSGEPPVEGLDQELALLEYWDGGRDELVCHVARSGPGRLSEVAVRTAPACAAGGDVSPTGAASSGAVCQGPLDCGFAGQCLLDYATSEMRCAPRACAGTGCTVFRLQPVSVTATEVIAHVYFDYSPMPVTVLDLKLEYSAETLELLDARPLPVLAGVGKGVRASHLPGGELRLVVAGGTSITPVPYGAIVELVFLRSDASRAAYVAFSDDPVHRRYSMAPEQGLSQAELVDARLWGGAIDVPASSGDGPRALLAYRFDDAGAPLAVKSVSSAASLCERLGSWCTPGRMGSLTALQDGLVVGGANIDGVRLGGLYLRGGQDHIRFPLTHDVASERSFTLSGWLYAEAAFSEPRKQLVFSHLAMDERTAFGLELVPEADGTFNLVWFEGPFDAGAVETVVRGRLPRLRWTHVAVAYDAEAGEVSFFVDGEPAGSRVFAQGLACPQVEPSLRLRAQNAGDVVYFARPESGVDHIVRGDPLALAVAPVFPAGPRIEADPDYHAGTDRIAYVSNESGAREVWVSDRLGQRRRRLTNGFGDAARGIAARHPRWSQSGRALVFESNVPLPGRSAPVSQLYYLPLDRFPEPQMLEYAKVADPSWDRDYRVTAGAGHAGGAAWLSEQDGRGEIVYTETSADLRRRVVKRLVIDSGQPMELPLEAGGGDLGESTAVLDAWVSGDGQRRELLVARSWTELTTTSQLRAEVVSDDGTSLRVRVSFSPSGYDEACWDRNHDGVLQGDSEDLDGDGLGTVADCYPSSLHDHYLAHDPSLTHEPGLDVPGAVLVGELGKVIQLVDEYSAEEGLVLLDVAGVADDRPLPAGIELATLTFTRGAGAGLAPFEAKVRRGRSAVYHKVLAGVVRPLALEGHLQEVVAGAFSPDGGVALLSGLAQSRPTLIRVALSGVEAPLRLGHDTSVIGSLSYRRQEQLMACNWIGGYRDPYTGIQRAGFVGGLDEIALYSYARPEAVVRSEAQRGREWLVKAGRDGELLSRSPVCSQSDVECPRYMLCNRSKGVCETVPCTPEPGACARVLCTAANPPVCSRGLCTARPAGRGDAAGSWVCTAECVVDSECFSEECLNGPCRFCDQETASCVECRETVSRTGPGEPPQVAVEGCPDGNSYSCQEGTCRSECFSSDGNQSQYVCQAPVEQCVRGRCVTADWSWDNLAPATLLGADETSYDPDGSPSLAFRKVATSNRTPIRIAAFGASDYLHPPQVLVEGCLGGGCFAIGEITVDNVTSALERRPWYVLESAWRFDRLRLRLRVGPHDDVAAACAAGTVCVRGAASAPGSLYSLGYPAEVPTEVIRAAGGQVDQHLARPYLRPGAPAVVVTRVEVQGTSYAQPVQNVICSYEGEREPVVSSFDPQTGLARRRERKMVFGRYEVSNHRTRFETELPWSPSWGLVDLAPASKGWAVLNCAYDNPAEGTTSAVYDVLLAEPQDSAISELGGRCRYTSSGEDCWAWAYRPTVDPLSIDGQVLFKTLELEDFGSLGP